MKIIRNLFVIILLLVAATFLVLNNKTTTTNTSVTLKPELAVAINTCDGITEKAASHLVAIVAFQKLEIAGRKVAVFKTCMKDHGYKENPKWGEEMAPTVERNANSMNISIDEAHEHLRRVEMKLLTLKQNKQVFWVKKRATD